MNVLHNLQKFFVGIQSGKVTRVRGSLWSNARDKYPGYGSVRTLQNATFQYDMILVRYTYVHVQHSTNTILVYDTRTYPYVWKHP